MPGGLWIATLIFVFATIAFNAVALASNIYNIFYNPVEFYASPIVIVIIYGVTGKTGSLILDLKGLYNTTKLAGFLNGLQRV